MFTRIILLFVAIFSSSLAFVADRPNILFCIADDWGWPHAGAYGDQVVKTPTFDRIAKEGVLFQHAYVSSPSCTPCRNSIMTGDHGMPFPRCKSILYDCGTQVPLAMRWGAKVKSGQVLDGFVSLIDLAPTFLATAGLTIPEAMTGRSLLPAVVEGKGDAALRPFILNGKERHVPSQEAPDMGGYPSRRFAIMTFSTFATTSPIAGRTERPNWENTAIPGAWYADTDNGPTKSYIIDNKDKDEAHRQAYQWCFAKRPADELFDLKKDSHQLHNVAGDAAYADQLKQTSNQLTAELKAAGDPPAVQAELVLISMPCPTVEGAPEVSQCSSRFEKKRTSAGRNNMQPPSDLELRNS